MKTVVNPVFLTMALLLHAALIAAMFTGSAKKQNKPLPSLTVSLIPPETAPAEATPAPSPPSSQSPPPPAPRKATKPAPIAKTRPRRPARPAPVPDFSDTPLDTPAPAAEVREPSESALPSTSAPAPVKTDASIPASYAASNRKPEYPALSKRYGEQGTVLLRILVKEDGTAGEIQLKASSGFPLLDKSAINAVKDWRFNPATVDGKPVAEWYQVSIPFKLEK